MLKRIKKLIDKVDRIRDTMEPAGGNRGLVTVRGSDLRELFAERERLEAHIRNSFALFSQVTSTKVQTPPCILSRLEALREEDLAAMCQAAYEAGYRGLDTSILFEVLEESGFFIGEAAEYQSGNTRKDLEWFKAKVDEWIACRDGKVDKLIARK